MYLEFYDNMEISVSREDMERFSDNDQPKIKALLHAVAEQIPSYYEVINLRMDREVSIRFTICGPFVNGWQWFFDFIINMNNTMRDFVNRDDILFPLRMKTELDTKWIIDNGDATNTTIYSLIVKPL